MSVLPYIIRHMILLMALVMMTSLSSQGFAKSRSSKAVSKTPFVEVMGGAVFVKGPLYRSGWIQRLHIGGEFSQSKKKKWKFIGALGMTLIPLREAIHERCHHFNGRTRCHKEERSWYDLYLFSLTPTIGAKYVRRRHVVQFLAGVDLMRGLNLGLTGSAEYGYHILSHLQIISALGAGLSIRSPYAYVSLGLKIGR